MNNFDIHRMFNRSDLRNQILTTFKTLEDKEKSFKLKTLNHNNIDDTIYDCCNVHNCNREIEYHLHMLEILKQRHNTYTLINMIGWQVFHIPLDKHNLSIITDTIIFIGTKSEYDGLIKSLPQSKL